MDDDMVVRGMAVRTRETYLSAVTGVEKVTPAGSLRRGKETVGDLDILVTGPGAAGALDAFVAHPKVHEVLGKGPNKASVKYSLEGVQVDVRALPAENYGAAILRRSIEDDRRNGFGSRNRGFLTGQTGRATRLHEASHQE
jgi:DNA polymerase (family 10)